MRTFVKELALLALFLCLHSALLVNAQQPTEDPVVLPEGASGKGGALEVQGLFMVKGLRWKKDDSILNSAERVLPLSLALLPLLGLVSHTLYF